MTNRSNINKKEIEFSSNSPLANQNKKLLILLEANKGEIFREENWRQSCAIDGGRKRFSFLGVLTKREEVGFIYIVLF